MLKHEQTVTELVGYQWAALLKWAETLTHSQSSYTSQFFTLVFNLAELLKCHDGKTNIKTQKNKKKVKTKASTIVIKVLKNYFNIPDDDTLSIGVEKVVSFGIATNHLCNSPLHLRETGKDMFYNKNKKVTTKAGAWSKMHQNAAVDRCGQVNCQDLSELPVHTDAFVQERQATDLDLLLHIPYLKLIVLTLYYIVNKMRQWRTWTPIQNILFMAHFLKREIWLHIQYINLTQAVQSRQYSSNRKITVYEKK